MSASVRTIRMLDRQPGQRQSEAREVGGITLEKGVPVPETRTTGLMQALRALEVGESFTYHRHIKNAPKRVAEGRKFVCRRHGASGYRVWRVK